MPNWFLTEMQKLLNWGKIIFSISSALVIWSHREKKKTKINQTNKQKKTLNLKLTHLGIKHKTTIWNGKRIGEYLRDLELDHVIRLNTESTIHKVKTDKLGFMKIKMHPLWMILLRGWETSYKLGESICKPCTRQRTNS